MRKFTLLAAALAAAGIGCASTTSLAGFWEFRYDPKSIGEASHWEGSDATDGWTRIAVPGSYSQSMHNNVLYQGKGWYRTTFAVALKSGERTWLRFDGVAIRAKVWVNGKLAGEHLFPYLGFTLDVTALVRAGSNSLVVLADNELLERAIPDKKCDGWWIYGGITRGVYVETGPEVRTGEVVFESERSGTGWGFQLRLGTENAGAAADGSIAVTMEDPAGRKLWSSTRPARFAPGRTETLLSAANLNASAWSPESPALYVLKVVTTAGAGKHEKSVRAGFRQIEVRGTRILLNGKAVFLKGANYHEMYPGSGATLDRAQVRKDLEDMRALGANFVRLAHYTHDEQVYELADELGLMVWSEIPAWQTRAETLGDDEVWTRYGAPQLTEMIEQRRTHPSIVVWSVGNEFPSEKEAVAGYVKRACELVRKMDRKRLVTFASDRRGNDISFGFVDFIAINEYYGWYYGSIGDLGPVLDTIHRKWPDKPVVVTEFGSESIPGWSNPMPGEQGMDYSEDYQMKLVGTHLRHILDPSRESFMAGALLWLYADFPNPSAFLRPMHPPIASYMNCKGLVTDDRRHKRVYEVVREAFRSR